MIMKTKTHTASYNQALRRLRDSFSGELDFSATTKLLYATDASIYKEMPRGVAFPKNNEDIKALLHFANTTQIPLIARGSGTSLAGQVVGAAIVVDVSLHMNAILELNKTHTTPFVRVQPGVIRDDLNTYLKPHGLFFPPETASASRATIGGMIGNNSTGANSITYGTTRDYILALKGYLADGSPVICQPLSATEYQKKLAHLGINTPPKGHLNHHLLPPEQIHHNNNNNTREAIIYKTLTKILSDQKIQNDLETAFPHPAIMRRNTGYALDLLGKTEPFNKNSTSKSQMAAPFNLATLIAGSEGTLMFITEATLKLVNLPAPCYGVIAAHFNSIDDSLHANILALKYKPNASELIDHYIIECTEKNLEQRYNRDFIKGRPKAILIIAFNRSTTDTLNKTLSELQSTLLREGNAYHAPILTGTAAHKPWNIRKAGLGLLSNIVGDAKPIAVVEDAAVRVTQLPQFVADFNSTLKQHHFSCVHYAHAGAGELHLRPIVNIKEPSGQATIYNLAKDIAALVKSYRGSLSGEHGDGRSRSEFIPFLFGADIYKLFQTIKTAFDPHHLLNPHKITNAPKMNSNLRYHIPDHTPAYETYFDFSPYQGIVRLAEMCNGSGECRRSHLSEGLMCPSFMATRDERHTTRARANILRETLKNPSLVNPFTNKNVLPVLDLCLSCKGCKTQCPSSVDISMLKAEYLAHYYKKHTPSLRTKLFAYLPLFSHYGTFIPAPVKNTVLAWTHLVLKRLLKLSDKKFPAFSHRTAFSLLKSHMATAPNRPSLRLHTSSSLLETKTHPTKSHTSTITTHTKAKNNTPHPSKPTTPTQTLYLFIDEFTNYFASEVCNYAYLVLTQLGYSVKLLPITNSGRTFISAGLLNQAQRLTQQNLKQLQSLLTKHPAHLDATQTTAKAHSNSDLPLPFSIIGVEPSALLTFRDEAISLVRGEKQLFAKKIARHTYLLEEFLVRELEAGRIHRSMFPTQHKSIAYHTHCHAQSLSKPNTMFRILELISATPPQSLGQGCCGMAGTFGYEREHAALAKKIAQLRLIPALKRTHPETLVVASGFSCRDQISALTSSQPVSVAEACFKAL
ncbi:hypothetical protein COTS27_01476 [Spirochaetota bacterium]|nr:hypothetical protein COTS27_01476 [Spirochaetota bacterium]